MFKSIASAAFIVSNAFAQWGHIAPVPKFSTGNHYDPKDIMNNYRTGNMLTLNEAIRELKEDKYC